MINCSPSTRKTVNTYLDFIHKRATGEILTGAASDCARTEPAREGGQDCDNTKAREGGQDCDNTKAREGGQDCGNTKV